MSTTESMLSTADNPFNPFEQWDEWYDYDRAMGYNTPEYLARVAYTSPELSEADNLEAVRTAIEEIISTDLTNNYVIVEKRH